MTANQFNAALPKLGFTQVGLATPAINDRTIRRYASGQWPVPSQLDDQDNAKATNWVRDYQPPWARENVGQ